MAPVAAPGTSAATPAMPLPPPLLTAVPLPPPLSTAVSTTSPLPTAAPSSVALPRALSAPPLPRAAPLPPPLLSAVPALPPLQPAVHSTPCGCTVLLRLPPLHAVKVSPPRRAAAACQELRDARCGGAPCATEATTVSRGQPLAPVDFKHTAMLLTSHALPRAHRALGPDPRQSAPQSQTPGLGSRPACTPWWAALGCSSKQVWLSRRSNGRTPRQWRS